MSKNKGRYTKEQKLQAIKLIEQGYTRREIMPVLGIFSEGAIRLWERKYKNGGIEELLKDERGLKAKGRPRKIKE